METKKPKIESILPLTYLQRALLFHSQVVNIDQGIIQISCRLEGRLNKTAFKRSWQQAVGRHPALRSSVHWEKVKEPVQVIRPAASLPISYQDLVDLPPEEQKRTIIESKLKDVSTKFELTKASVNRLTVYQVKEEVHELLWTSHHILLDGWSAGVVLRDVFKFYDAEIMGRSADLPGLPSLQHYTNWLQKQDFASAAVWWEAHLKGFSKSTLLGSGAAAGADLKTREQRISNEEFSRINAALREHRLTLNTVAQGLWSLILNQLFTREDIVFGTTVSGRTPDIPNHNEMAGLFTNAIPVRVRINPEQSIKEWLQGLQTKNLVGAEFDFADMGKIMEWSGLTPNVLKFDHLLLIQNYPWSDLAGGGIRVADFTGDLTSTHPLVVMLKPQKELEFSFRYDGEQLPEETISWLLTGYIRLFQEIPDLLDLTIHEVQANLGTAPVLLSQFQAQAERSEVGYTAAGSATELRLAAIWEELLSISPVGVLDDFFFSGGTSMIAFRLFSRINQAFDKNLPPITILQHRTIRELAKLIDGNSVAAWTTIVPLKASGSKPAIFCFHAGMGHVFFYHPFAKLVDSDRPVYAIQPNGLDGKEEVHATIEEMAAHYLREIKKVQPHGPYIFLSYCFSTAVCVELSHLLRAESQPSPIMIVVDSAPLPMELNDVVEFRQKKKSLRWIAAHLYHRKFQRVKTALQLDYAPDFILSRELREEREINLIRDQFVPLYERYKWKKINCEVLLIRSTAFNSIPSKNWHLETWNYLSGQRLKTIIIEATHETFFDQPSLSLLAEAVNAYLKERV